MKVSLTVNWLLACESLVKTENHSWGYCSWVPPGTTEMIVSKDHHVIRDHGIVNIEDESVIHAPSLLWCSLCLHHIGWRIMSPSFWTLEAHPRRLEIGPLSVPMIRLESARDWSLDLG